MAKRLTIHRDNNPIYDIVIKNSYAALWRELDEIETSIIE